MLTRMVKVMSNECGCRNCINEKNKEKVDNESSFVGFIVCVTCGNKRCPHANDHQNACTNSNEPGQAGSAYQ